MKIEMDKNTKGVIILLTVVIVLVIIFAFYYVKPIGEKAKAKAAEIPQYEIKVVDPDKVVSIKLTDWKDCLATPEKMTATMEAAIDEVTKNYTIKSSLPLAVRDQHFGVQVVTYAILFIEPKNLKDK